MHSTVYTIGTALGRARDHGVEVRVLVSGHWVEGAVSEIDGHGVILTGSDSSHHVVRLTDVSAVHVSTHRPDWDTDEPATEQAWWAADDGGADAAAAVDDVGDEEEEPGDQDGGPTPRSILVAQ